MNDLLFQLMFNPLFWFLYIIICMIAGIKIRSRRRQKDIEKGVKKALEQMEKDKKDR